MINAIGNITGIVSVSQTLNGELNKSIEYVNPITQEKTIEPTKEVQVVEPDKGYTGLSKVTVEAISDEYDDIYDYFYNEFPTELYTQPKALMILKQIPKVSFSGQNASYLFYNFRALEKLDTSGIDTSNCTNMSAMFGDLHSLKELEVNHFDTSKVTNMYNLFGGLRSVEELDLSNWNTSNVTTMSYMFNSCFKIVTLDLSNFDMSKVTAIKDIFYDSSFKGLSLQNVIIGNYQLGKAYLLSQSENYSAYTFDLRGCPLLTHESLMNIINGLYDIATAGVKSQQLILSSTNLAKLTAEEIAIATNKGWNVS